MSRLLSLFGYIKPIPMHDHTDSRRTLRAIAHEKSGDVFADPTYQRHVERTTTMEERVRKADRIWRLRGATQTRSAA